MRCGFLSGWIVLVVVAATSQARPPLHTIVINTSSNIAAGSAAHIAVDRPELNSLTTTGAVRMYSPSANQWTVSVAVQGSAVSTSVNYKLLSRTTSSGTHCTTGNGSLSGATMTTNIPLWNPGYTGKTVYYHSSWTNAFILYRVGETATFADAPMTRIGDGRVAGEYRYQVTGIGEAGRPLEFVPHGRTPAGVEQYDNPAVGGIGSPANYYTPLDTVFLQDGNIFNYIPPATVSAPQIISVANWASSYTGNGIPSRGGRVYLPRGYTQNTTKRYPVLYMHDGQNVFDPGGSFGSWSADAAATREITQGRMRETIIVAVNNSNARFEEYCPAGDQSNSDLPGTGQHYRNYLVNNVMPNINSTYRTLTNKMDTGNMGSSLGGLISAYIGLSSNVFGLVGAVSPSYWYAPNFRAWINTQPTRGNRIWQCAGTTEGSSMWDYFWPVYGYYQADGYIENNDIMFAIGCGQEHNEAAWASRVAGAFQFLYNPWDETNLLETNVPAPAGSLQFTNAVFQIAESNNAVRFFISRSAGSNGAASVQYATASGTALEGQDFTSASGTLNWTNNDTAAKVFDVTILSNATFELTEYFTVVLSNAMGASLGAPSVATVTITDDDPSPPEISITNPAGDIVVSPETVSVDVQGEANPFNWTGLRWTNILNGASGVAPINLSWSIPGIPLGEGENVISVFATNSITGVATNAYDQGSGSVYSNGWIDADNGGTGFGAWILYTSSTNVNNNGRFMATNAAVDIGIPSWGLYANSTNLSEAKRILTNTMLVGQTLSVSLDNGFIDTGSGVGVAVQNITNGTLWEFFFNGGDQYYNISGGTTDVGWTSTGIDIEFTLTGPTSYLARITPQGGSQRTISGNLNASADSTITLFRAWNWNAGAGSDYDVFFNKLKLTTATSQNTSTGDTVMITRSASSHDGIPLSWWNQHGLGTNSAAGDDNDNDGTSNFEEYIADTTPTNAASVYSNRIVHAEGYETISIQTGTPTTNSRIYDVWHSADLMDYQWTPLNLNVQGAADGSAIMMNVTNAGEVGHYRTGVKLP
jgi:predicted alpha/beta superfamily hydrolase